MRNDPRPADQRPLGNGTAAPGEALHVAISREAMWVPRSRRAAAHRSRTQRPAAVRPCLAICFQQINGTLETSMAAHGEALRFAIGPEAAGVQEADGRLDAELALKSTQRRGHA